LLADLFVGNPDVSMPRGSSRTMGRRPSGTPSRPPLELRDHESYVALLIAVVVALLDADYPARDGITNLLRNPVARALWFQRSFSRSFSINPTHRLRVGRVRATQVVIREPLEASVGSVVRSDSAPILLL